MTDSRARRLYRNLYRSSESREVAYSRGYDSREEKETIKLNKMKDKLPQSCKQCEYNHISIDCCYCDWNNKVSIETTYFQKKNDGIPDYCPLNILYIAKTQ